MNVSTPANVQKGEFPAGPQASAVSLGGGRGAAGQIAGCLRTMDRAKGQVDLGVGRLLELASRSTADLRTP